MKKLFHFIIFILIVAGICAGSYYAYKEGYFDFVKKINNKSSSDSSPDKTSKPSVDYSAFPESWNNLYDIENVTITFSRTFMGGSSGTYKIVDNKYYLYNDQTLAFEETSSIYVLTYQKFYKSFTFNEGTNTYTALNVFTDDSAWMEDIEIKLVDGKIKTVITDNHQASLHIVTTYVFSSYGETIL